MMVDADLGRAAAALAGGPPVHALTVNAAAETA
jgi:hypothetical protein